MDKEHTTSGALAAEITKSSSKQTYYTIRFFADRERIDDAYRAYGYFRWVDDVLDAEKGTKPEKIAFINRQKSLLEALLSRRNTGWSVHRRMGAGGFGLQ